MSIRIFAVLQWKAQQVSYLSIATTENISYTRVQLYHDGSLRHYAWNQSRKKWDQQWSSFLEECDLYRRCTPNAYCHPGVSSSVCECIPGFEYSAINVISEVCVRKKHGACNGDHFSLLPKMNFPDAYNARSYPAINKPEQCGGICLGDCSCTAYSISRSLETGNRNCITWSGDLVDIRSYSDEGQDLYVRTATGHGN